MHPFPQGPFGRRDTGRVHKIKNPDADLTHAFFDLATLFKRRVIMTGTPVANRPEDIWAQVWFLDQGAAWAIDFASFQREVALTNDLAHDEGAQQAYEARRSGLRQDSAYLSVRENKSSGGSSCSRR